MHTTELHRQSRRVLTLVSAALAAVLGLYGPMSFAGASAPTGSTTSTATSADDARAVGQSVIRDLRHARHTHFDRVVIDFTGPRPEVVTGISRVHHYDGSGAVVPIRGGRWVVLRNAVAHDEDGNSTYDGPRLARPRYPTLKALAFTGDFEGQVSFAFGTDPLRAPYRMFWLRDPKRLVIDFLR